MIRDIPVYGDLILSPMAGFSDKPYRLICREYGSAMSYTEFVKVEKILSRSKEPTKDCILKKQKDRSPFKFTAMTLI